MTETIKKFKSGIRTTNTTIKEIDSFAKEKNIPSMMEAIIEFCRIKDMDITVVGEMIRRSETVKTKIKKEAQELYMLKC
jgi:hypothetical protein